MHSLRTRFTQAAKSAVLFALTSLLLACGTSANDRDPAPTSSCQGDDCEPPTTPETQGEGCEGDNCVQACQARSPDLCDGICVNTKTDPKHCGTCERTCADGFVCSDGRCDESCGGSSPNLCGGRCVNLTFDVEHCGSCGAACGEGEVCVEGTCEASCPSSAPVACDQLCKNVWDDPEHCGACNRECARTQVCSEGDCIEACEGTTPTQCGTFCRDLRTDPRACGGCDNACADGQVCDQGSCAAACEAGDACDGQCVDLDSDARHCGSCGRQCLAGAVCVDGFCARSCPEKTDQCGSSCVNFEDNPQHCGECGNTCPAAQSCIDGDCECAGDGQSLCDDVCVKLKEDEENCGKCGRKCPSAQTCEDGSCACPQESPKLCKDTCVDLSSDNLNCGTCGHACGERTVCEGGVCTSTIVELDYNNSLCALYDSSEVLCVGTAGPETGEDEYRPAKVANFISGFSADPVQLSLGNSFPCALVEGGTIECWGNFYGQMGDVTSSKTPLPFALPHTSPVKELIAGNGNSLALHEDGELSTWGSNNFNMLGHPGPGPGLVLDLAGPVAVADSMPAGMCARLTRENDAKIQCWGLNQSIFGVDDAPTAFPPTFIDGLETPDEDVVLEQSLAMSYGTLCAIVGAGQLACWGDNYYGKLGVPLIQDKSDVPLVVQGLPARVTEVHMTQQSACALLETRDLYCWGTNFGAPYDPEVSSTHEPTLVLSDVERVTPGVNTGWFALVAHEGTWYSWGGALGREYGDTSQALPCCDF